MVRKILLIIENLEMIGKIGQDDHSCFDSMRNSHDFSSRECMFASRDYCRIGAWEGRIHGLGQYLLSKKDWTLFEYMVHGLTVGANRIWDL